MLDTIEPVEQMEVAEPEPEPEWQKAKHEVSQKDLEAADVDHPLNVQSGSTGSIKQKIEEEAVLDYLSDKIYGGPASTIREYLANAETACLRAAEMLLKRDGGWDEDDFFTTDDDGNSVRLPPTLIIQFARQEVGYEPTIEIEWYREEDLLVIQDNGIGFTPREVTDVLAYTGRSGVRDRGDVSGQFGMGVLSAHKAVGKEGSYTLITRTRRDDVPDWARDGFAVYCYLGGYDPIEGSMPENQFGSRFELPLKREDGEEFPFQNKHGSRYGDDEPKLRQWIAKYSEWMRVPVLYHEFEDGETVFDDEYGEKGFAEDYDGAVLEIDHEAFYAKCYPQSNSETLLLSMPIERNYRYTPGSAPWQVDIRFRNENGIVVAGPHKGLMPIDEAEYRNMDDERKELFVCDDELVQEDVKLPQPDASRDALQHNEQFWKWVGDEFDKLYKQKIADVAEEVKDDPQALKDMAGDRPNDFSFLMVGFSNYRGYRSKTVDDFRDQIENAINVKLSDDVTKLCLRLLESVELCPRGRSGVSKKARRSSEKVWRIFRNAAPDGTVYMGCSINEDRCAVAWETHDDNEVVRVENTSDYDRYKDQLGWELLKNVPTSSSSKGADSFTIPEKLKKGGSSKNNAGKDAADRTLTIRKDTGQRNSTNMSCRRIKETLQDAHDDSSDVRGLKLSYSTYANELILFPSTDSKNVSDWYSISKPFSHRAVATCTKSAYEYLKDVPGIMHVDDFITESKDVQITTNEGDMTIDDAGNRLVVHVVDDTYLDRFRDEDVMQALAEWLYEEIEAEDFSYSYDHDKHPDSFVYAPVDNEAWQRIQPSNLENQFIVIGGSLRPNGSRHTVRYSSDPRLYAQGRLSDWDAEIEELQSLANIAKKSTDEQTFAIVDTLAMLHDNGIKPASLQEDGIEGLKLTAVKQGKQSTDNESENANSSDEKIALADGSGE